MFTSKTIVGAENSKVETWVFSVTIIIGMLSVLGLVVDDAFGRLTNTLTHTHTHRWLVVVPGGRMNPDMLGRRSSRP